MTSRVLRFKEQINGREYRIEVAAVGAHRWRAQVMTVHGGPTALMPFYGTTPELAAQRTHPVPGARQPQHGGARAVGAGPDPPARGTTWPPASGVEPRAAPGLEHDAAARHRALGLLKFGYVHRHHAHAMRLEPHLAIACYLAAVSVAVRLDPKAGPRGERVSWHERLVALGDVWGVLILFLIVIGGIYGGLFTPTEAAGIGAGGGLVFLVARKGWNWRELRIILVESAITTGMIFTILIGALIFANFINMTGMPGALTAYAEQFRETPLLVIIAILVIYVALGCLLESMSMILLTVPMFYPLVAHLGYDLIWFGIIVVVVTEISMITPPVGGVYAEVVEKVNMNSRSLLLEFSTASCGFQRRMLQNCNISATGL